MDAHHATEPTATKPSASPASSAPLATITNSSTPATAAKSDNAHLSSSSSMPHKIDYERSTLPPVSVLTKKNDSKVSTTPSLSHAHDNAHDDDGTVDNNSEAETIVLNGEDGSPVKPRKPIKREDTSDSGSRSHVFDVAVKRKPAATSSSSATDTKPESNGSLREGSHGVNAAKAGASKPPADVVKRKRLVDQQTQKSDVDSVHAKPAKSTSHRPTNDTKDSKEHQSRDRERERERDRDRDGAGTKAKSGDRVVSQKRKVPRDGSDDEADPEFRKARRPRTSTSIDASSSRPPQKDRDYPKTSANKTTHDTSSTRHRSTSPQTRNHRRSASMQVASSGLSHKKKRVPPPVSTDYLSDASSISGSPRPRSTTTRGLATPATAESMASAHRNPPIHKKHVDAHGQTQLAKACIKGDLESVKRRLSERPADKDYSDYAGNTPLQFAAINGHEHIVDFLIKNNCNIHCMNSDKDTPLLDAVENGHLEVVKILLDAGVNPRKANRKGQEPLDLVDHALEDADAIRDALINAKKTDADARRASTEDPQDDHSSHGANSPRPRSPSYAEPSSSRRAASSRHHKMSNKVLYTPLTLDELRDAAGTGNLESVQQILTIHEHAIKEHGDDQSMVAAAKGGHYGVLNLLLAIGECNPDPDPVRGKNEEYSTPILAAIGQENCEVIKLLLMQSSFNPTRLVGGETYYEIARKRAGPSWREEETILKKAYDEYRKIHRDAPKKSPNRRDLDSKRAGRSDSRDGSVKSFKRKATSPSREAPRSLSKAKAAEKEYKGTSSRAPKFDEAKSPKFRGGSKPKKDETGMPTMAKPDAAASPRPPRSPKPKRSDADAAAMSSDGEAKPHVRHRLFSRKEQQTIESSGRRGSMVSTSSSLRDPGSPGDTRHDEVLTEKYHDRAKSIKEYEARDKSRDRLSASEHTAKRSRSSATPDLGTSEKEGEPVKKRRLDVDKKDQAAKPSVSPDRNRKSAPSRDSPSSLKQDKSVRKHGDHLEKTASSKPRKSGSAIEQTRRESGGKSVSSDRSIHVNVKAEDSDVVMRDADAVQGEESRARAKEDEKERHIALEARRKQKEKEAEEQKLREDEQRRQAEIKRQDEEKKRAQEEERKRQEEEARKKREAEEAAEAQRKAQEELEKRQAEEARILREKEEQERQKREEERIRIEQEAAAEARRKREEDERKEQERRALEELRQRQIREEQEQRRLARLPASLRWLECSTNAKTPEMAKRLRYLKGVRFDSIRPETAGTSEGRELWFLNTQVAMLLGESDLQLTRFSGWARVPASQPAKQLVLGLASPKPGLIDSRYWDLGRNVPGCYLEKDPALLTREEKQKLTKESNAKFLALDLFFVKLSDLMAAIPNIPHLRNVELTVTQHEAAETLEQHDDLQHPERWRNDPDADKDFCPRTKYYVDGKLVREGKVDRSSASSTPHPDNRAPRDDLTAVAPTDPNYARLAKEQGTNLYGLRTPPMTVAAQTSPNQAFSGNAFGDLSPPQSESAATTSGDGHHQPRSSTSSTAEQDRPVVNGTAIPLPPQNGTENNG